MRCLWRKERTELCCAQGTGFPHSERERLGLRGLLPHKQLKVDVQVGPALPLSCWRCLSACAS